MTLVADPPPASADEPSFAAHTNQTRLLFGPTGRSLDGGSGYLASHLIFFPSFAYGLTDRVTIGGGFSLIPDVSIDDQLFFVTPKVGLVRSEQLNLAVGAWVGGFPATATSRGPAGSCTAS